jgi:ketosteroid isomerase-like protein
MGRYAVPDRLEVERLLRELYAARLGGDLEALCRTFAQDARLEIAGTSYSSPMAIRAAGLVEIRSWLALLVKTFQLSDQEILSMIIDGEAAAVHWRARIRSKITGATVLTELVDVVRVREGRIASYTEFFVPLKG